MSLVEQLNKLEHEIDTGMLFKAVERLKILINQYPDNISLRNKLSLLYYEAGFKDAAGRYWILCDSTQEHIINAVEVYKQSVNYSPSKILQDIKFRGDYDKLPVYSQQILNELKKAAGTKRQHTYSPSRYLPYKSNSNRFIEIGCLIIVVIMAALLVHGFIMLLKAIKDFFS